MRSGRMTAWPPGIGAISASTRSCRISRRWSKRRRQRARLECIPLGPERLLDLRYGWPSRQKRRCARIAERCGVASIGAGDDWRVRLRS